MTTKNAVADVTWSVVTSPLGWIGLAEDDGGLVAVSLGESSDKARAGLEAELGATLTTDPARLSESVTLVALAGGGMAPAPAVNAKGTAFQHAVWDATSSIPRGETRSYAEVAAMIGRPGSARAVGTALAQNPTPLAVPCHRVVRGDGSLGEYGWGAKVKERLLGGEGGL